MSLKILKNFFLATILLFSLLVTNTVFACDNKNCESAYLAENKQTTVNHIRRAYALRVERKAYSLNRERRAYALNRERRAYAEHVHKYFISIRRSI